MTRRPAWIDPWRGRNRPRTFSNVLREFAAPHGNALPESRFWVQSRATAAEATPVSRPDYYRQYALECLRLANESNEPSTKAVLIDMAQAWIKLVEQAQRNRRLDLVHPPPSPRNLPAAS
jgi:hypothetical protein